MKSFRHVIDRAVEEQFARGLSRDEARRVATVEFGGLEQVKERVRDGRAAAWLDSVLADIRYASRRLLQRPSFTLLALLTMTLGIGAATATFSILDVVVLRPLPYKRAARLVSVETRIPFFAKDASFAFAANDDFGLTYGQYLALRKVESVFADLGTLWRRPATFVRNREPRRLHVAYASASFFSVLDIEPFRGRLFLSEDEHADSAQTIVLSHQFWAGTLGADPNLIGQSLTLEQNGRPAVCTVIGILPPEFQFARRNFADFDPTPDLWLAFRPDRPTSASTAAADSNFEVVAVLNEGISTAMAETNISRVVSETAPDFITATLGKEVARVMRLQDAQTREYRTILISLFALGAISLALIGLYGVISRMVASRTGELGVRMAVGATSGNIMGLVLRRSMTLVFAGIVIGMLCAFAGSQALSAFLSQISPVDAATYLSATAGFIVTSLLASYIPARRASKIDPNDCLRAE